MLSISFCDILYDFIKDYSIDTSKGTYIGIWNGDEVIVSSSNELNIETNIGVDGGRGTDVCSVSIEKGIISIGNKDYIANESPIQVVVYDNNYKKVVDNVNLCITKDNIVGIKRP